jgi:histo-blood group ABO system transferase
MRLISKRAPRISLAFLGMVLWGVSAEAAKVALCITATGRYVNFAKDLVESCRPLFLCNHDVTYFIFTDQPLDAAPDVKVKTWKRFGWPWDSMNRTSAYLSAEKELIDFDWVFASDADMLCVGSIGDEILGQTVGTTHPGFVNRAGSFEGNPRSCAYVPRSLRRTYYAGGLYGGSADGFLDICRECQKAQQQDSERGVMAIWHDESHLNRYFSYHPPAVTLSHYYCFDDRRIQPGLPIKYVARSKDHAACRAP